MKVKKWIDNNPDIVLLLAWGVVILILTIAAL